MNTCTGAIKLSYFVMKRVTDVIQIFRFNLFGEI